MGQCGPKRLDFRSTSACFSFLTTKSISFFKQDVFFTFPVVQFGAFCIQTMLSTSMVFSRSMNLKVVNHINLIWKQFRSCATMTARKAPLHVCWHQPATGRSIWRHWSPPGHEDLKTSTMIISQDIEELFVENITDNYRPNSKSYTIRDLWVRPFPWLPTLL
jgi:hypothetical protein